MVEVTLGHFQSKQKTDNLYFLSQRTFSTGASTIKEAMDPELIAVKFEKQVVSRKEKREIFSTIIAC